MKEDGFELRVLLGKDKSILKVSLYVLVRHLLTQENGEANDQVAVGSLLV